MLRALVALLILGNLGFYAWSQGWLDKVTGTRSHTQREPERLALQVHPEFIEVLPAGAVATPATPASAAPETDGLACWQAGPFSAAEVGPAEAALRVAVPDLASHGYRNVASDQAGVWAVYMGKYLGAELLERKEAELRRRNLDYEVLPDGDALGPGFLLGRHDSAAAAAAGLAEVERHGVHTAKVVVLTAPSAVHRLRVESADAATRARLQALNDPSFATHHFERCGDAAPPPAPASAASAGAASPP